VFQTEEHNHPKRQTPQLVVHAKQILNNKSQRNHLNLQRQLQQARLSYLMKEVQENRKRKKAEDSLCFSTLKKCQKRKMQSQLM
jgi:hypothetical protein